MSPLRGPRWWRPPSVAYLVLLGLALLLCVWRPVGFQKASALRPWSGPLPGIASEGPSLDVDAVVGSIPYRERPRQVWAVAPEERYQRTIVEGDGNCSNLVFGLSYGLLRDGVDFQILHLMDPATYMDGAGHTVVRTAYTHDGERRTGIVDVLHAGLPRSEGRRLDVASLRAPVPAFSMESLNPRRRAQSPYYGAFLEDAVLGFIPADEVESYFRFLETVRVPLGSERLAKYVYDGLAVLLGFYPRIFVPRFDELVAPRSLEHHLHRGALWVLRSAIAILPLILLAEWRARRGRA